MWDTLALTTCLGCARLGPCKVPTETLCGLEPTHSGSLLFISKLLACIHRLAKPKESSLRQKRHILLHEVSNNPNWTLKRPLYQDSYSLPVFLATLVEG